eukprot:3238497-Pyramimonas_sp.AAC.1
MEPSDFDKSRLELVYDSDMQLSVLFEKWSEERLYLPAGMWSLDFDPESGDAMLIDRTSDGHRAMWVDDELEHVVVQNEKGE